MKRTTDNLRSRVRRAVSRGVPLSRAVSRGEARGETRGVDRGVDRGEARGEVDPNPDVDSGVGTDEAIVVDDGIIRLNDDNDVAVSVEAVDTVVMPNALVFLIGCGGRVGDEH